MITLRHPERRVSLGDARSVIRSKARESQGPRRLCAGTGMRREQDKRKLELDRPGEWGYNDSIVQNRTRFGWSGAGSTCDNFRLPGA